ncbi:MAG TPA: toxin-antitoxin system YwqK family antitoxin [Bacteroidales bacterium]|nr:toxin-antitoxin system YwqK family antitoxin [Bacteroidales bacterium]
MKNLLLLLAIVVIAVSCDSSQKNNPDGTWVKKEYYDNGNILKCEMQLKDSLRHGVTRNYDRKGKLMSMAHFVNNKKEGVAINYYPSGIINQEMVYKDNKLEGEAKMYYETGKLYMISHYLNNKKQGLEQTFYESGKLKSEQEYYNGGAGIGLKEYSTSGEEVTKKPTIVIREINPPFEEKLILEISLSNKSSNVKFYQDTLVHGKYMYKYMNSIDTRNGVGRLTWYKSGLIQMKKLNIVAEVTTQRRNKLIIQRSYNLVVN